jgi:hypothetical protein
MHSEKLKLYLFSLISLFHKWNKMGDTFSLNYIFSLWCPAEHFQMYLPFFSLTNVLLIYADKWTLPIGLCLAASLLGNWTFPYFILRWKPFTIYLQHSFLASIGMLIHVKLLWNHVYILFATVILLGWAISLLYMSKIAFCTLPFGCADHLSLTFLPFNI